MGRSNHLGKKNRFAGNSQYYSKYWCPQPTFLGECLLNNTTVSSPAAVFTGCRRVIKGMVGIGDIVWTSTFNIEYKWKGLELKARRTQYCELTALEKYSVGR